MIISDRIRYFTYLAGVITNQLQDPFCRKCKARVNTAGSARTDLALFEQECEQEMQSLSPDMVELLSTARRWMADMILDENAAGRKRVGNCRLPEGICFVKSARNLLRQKS